MNWLEDHLKNFVEPILGYVPEESIIPYFSAREKVYIKNTWRAVKRQACGKRLILTGRDVYIFEVLARRENYPTLYRPDCSRVTVSKMDFGDMSNSVLFDTGFAGSIPMRLGVEFMLFSAVAQNKQIFPSFKEARRLAMKIETSPKYWESARLMNGEIKMDLSFRPTFRQATLLTIEIYKDSTPNIEYGRRVTSTSAERLLKSFKG